jgi:hypothetical protein
MTRIGLFIRILMFVTCLVPFTSTRQVAAAFVPVGTSAPIAPAPLQGQQEDESEREKESDGQAKQRVSHNSGEPSETPRLLRRLPRTATVTHHSTSVPAALATPDPFRNGLGTPYRC